MLVAGRAACCPAIFRRPAAGTDAFMESGYLAAVA